MTLSIISSFCSRLRSEVILYSRVFLVTLFRIGFFTRSLLYNSWFSPTWNRGSLLGLRFQYLVRLLSLCWITGGHTIHPPIELLLPSTGIDPIPFRHSASKVAGLQVDVTKPGLLYSWFLYRWEYQKNVILRMSWSALRSALPNPDQKFKNYHSWSPCALFLTRIKYLV